MLLSAEGDVTGPSIPVAVLVALFGLAASGCAAVPISVAQPNESIRPSLGTVGVVSVVEAPVARINQTGPVGAGQGALAGIGSVLDGASGTGQAAIFAIPFLPVGALVGAIIGANNVIPRDKADEIRSTISRALVEQEPEIRLRRQIIARASTNAKQDLVDLGVAGNVDAMTPAGYATFAQRGGRTVLEVSISSVVLVTGGGGDDPDFVFEIGARARLVDTANGQIRWLDDHLTFSTTSHKFSEWKTKDAALLKSVIDGAVESFARRISDGIFLGVWIPPGD
jgi:hypothetical protein